MLFFNFFIDLNILVDLDFFDVSWFFCIIFIFVFWKLNWLIITLQVLGRVLLFAGNWNCEFEIVIGILDY